MENEYLEELLEECQENNRLLREHNKLLNDKVSFVEHKCDKTFYIRNVKKNLNTSVSIQSKHTDNEPSDLHLPKAILTRPSKSRNNVKVTDKTVQTVAEVEQTNILKLNKNKREEIKSIEIPWRKVVSKRTRTIGTAKTT